MRKNNDKVKTRFCIPFNIKCLSCNDLIPKNKRFNTIREEIKDQDYHGIKIYKFVFKCSACKSEISIRTDPEHGEYKVNSGCYMEEYTDKESKKPIRTLKDIDKLKEDIYKLYKYKK